MMNQTEDILLDVRDHVAVVTLNRPPHNFFDLPLITRLADLFDFLDGRVDVRAIVLAAQGDSFCAGADFSRQSGAAAPSVLYAQAARLFAARKPVVGAIQGPAIGGGLGLALVPDFRIAAPEARFAANFVKLGIHPGFGLTLTLPRLIGAQQAALLLYTGRRINAAEAFQYGIVDAEAPKDKLLSAAIALAAEIAEAAPLAVVATRATLRRGLANAFLEQARHESEEQAKLFATEDFREGVRAVAERRAGRFVGG